MGRDNANVEGVGAVETGKLLSLSEQQLMDCDTSDGSCQGGLPSNAFQFMIDNGMGLEDESSYPYKAADGSCHSSASSEKAFITAWHQISTDETQIAAAVQQYGPLSIGINANTFQNYQSGSCGSQDEDGLKASLAKNGPLSICVNAESWNSYNGGVSTGSCSGAYNKLDHCVQLVGYDTTAATPYWIVKNSWGTSWGEDGHIWLEMGKNACGIADEAMYVTAELATTVV